MLIFEGVQKKRWVSMLQKFVSKKDGFLRIAASFGPILVSHFFVAFQCFIQLFMAVCHVLRTNIRNNRLTNLQNCWNEGMSEGRNTWRKEYMKEGMKDINGNAGRNEWRMEWVSECMKEWMDEWVTDWMNESWLMMIMIMIQCLFKALHLTHNQPWRTLS